YRIEILELEEQGAGAAAVTFGYRMGMIVSGGGALFVASRYGWQAAYLFVGVLIFSGFLISCFIGEKPFAERPKHTAARWIKEAVIDPFADFITRENWIIILLFVLVYKLPEAFAIAITTPFILKLGFSLEDVATVIKTFGTAATIVGAFFSGWLIAKTGIMRALLIGGILQIISNFMFIVQARAGAQIDVLYATTAIEYFSSGIATGALVAYLGSLTKINFTATQFALLTSIAALGRTVLSSRTGYIADEHGWEIFYVISALLGLPGVILLYFLKEPTVFAESRRQAKEKGEL
ncbi:MAG: MFS transporter, partial [Pseudomonadota bacterium]